MIWILVNCNSYKEAENIGNKIINKRLASCFDIYERKLARYFWPPKTGEIEESRGALLIIETLEEKYNQASEIIGENHSDNEPFIGYIKINGVGESYLTWMKGEVR